LFIFILSKGFRSLGYFPSDPALKQRLRRAIPARDCLYLQALMTL
jgi:hypothetical protein